MTIEEHLTIFEREPYFIAYVSAKIKRDSHPIGSPHINVYKDIVVTYGGFCDMRELIFILNHLEIKLGRGGGRIILSFKTSMDEEKLWLHVALSQDTRLKDKNGEVINPLA